MIGVYANVISLAGLQDAGPELVKSWIILSGFDLIDESARLRRARFPAAPALSLRRSEDVDIKGDIAVGDVENEIDQLWVHCHGR